MGHGKSWPKSKTQDKSKLFQNKYDSNHTWQVSFILAEDQPLLCVKKKLFVCPLFYIQLHNIRSYGDIIVAIEGLQNLGLSLAPTPIEQWEIFIIMSHLAWHRTSVFEVSSEGRPVVSHLLWQFALIGVLRTCSKQDPRPRNIKGKHPSI